MKCPHCGVDIDDKLIAKEMGARGGRKSKRKPPDKKKGKKK